MSRRLTPSEVVQELERRRDRADAAGKGDRNGWFAGNSYGLGEAIALLRDHFTQQPASTYTHSQDLQVDQQPDGGGEGS